MAGAHPDCLFLVQDDGLDREVAEQEQEGDKALCDLANDSDCVFTPWGRRYLRGSEAKKP